MSFYLEHTGPDGETLRLTDQNRFKNIAACKGCDCEAPCQWHEFRTIEGVMSSKFEHGLEVAIAFDFSKNKTIEL